MSDHRENEGPVSGNSASSTSTTWSNRIRSTAGEFLLIVAGVGVALGAQAWWQYHENRGREHEYLESLNSDAEENAVAIRSAIAEDSAYRVRSANLLRMLQGATPMNDDSLDNWMRVSFSDFYPLTGTLETLIGTGDIRLIHSDSVRRAVGQLASEYSAVVEDLRLTGEAAWAIPLAEVLADHRQQGRRYDIHAIATDPRAFVVALKQSGVSSTRLAALRRLDSLNARVVRLTDAELGRDAARN